MSITRLNNHDLHEVIIHSTRGSGPHYAALKCVDCNKHIQWLNHKDTKNLTNAGVKTTLACDNQEESL